MPEMFNASAATREQLLARIAELEANHSSPEREILLRRLIDLQDSERRLVASDIHDGFVQEVIGAQLYLQGLKEKLPRQYDQEVDRILQHLQRGIEEARRLISGIRPMALDAGSVAGAIEQLIAEQQSSAGQEIRLEANDLSDLEPLRAAAVFRIVQEAIANIRRHSEASRAEISLLRTDSTLQIEIRDNGKGFDPCQIPADHYGIRGMLERVRIFGGQAEIKSSPGEGTRVLAELPLG